MCDCANLKLSVCFTMHLTAAYTLNTICYAQESGEHMPEKQRFVGELCRVAAPGEIGLGAGGR